MYDSIYDEPNYFFILSDTFTDWYKTQVPMSVQISNNYKVLH